MKNVMMLFLALIMSLSTMAQQRRITGNVRDSQDNSAMIGVNAIEKGASNGTITNIDGNFSLDVTTKDPELVLSSIEYLTRDFSWATDFIYSTNKEVTVELYNGKVDDIGNSWFIGDSSRLFI